MKYFFLSFILIGCDTVSSAINEDLIYTKDNRTNVCYSIAHYHTDHPLFTYVPCTDAVEKQIIADKNSANGK